MASDPFDNLLGAAAKHLKDESQRQADEDSMRRRAHEQFVAQLNEAIGDWNNRIVPLVDRTVARSNQLMNETGIQIAVLPEQSEPAPHALGRIPGLPALHVVHQGQARNVATLSAPGVSLLRRSCRMFHV
jgi:hypothetical protein